MAQPTVPPDEQARLRGFQYVAGGSGALAIGLVVVLGLVKIALRLHRLARRYLLGDAKKIDSGKKATDEYVPLKGQAQAGPLPIQERQVLFQSEKKAADPPSPGPLQRSRGPGAERQNTPELHVVPPSSPERARQQAWAAESAPDLVDRSFSSAGAPILQEKNKPGPAPAASAPDLLDLERGGGAAEEEEEGCQSLPVGLDSRLTVIPGEPVGAAFDESSGGSGNAPTKGGKVSEHHPLSPGAGSGETSGPQIIGRVSSHEDVGGGGIGGGAPKSLASPQGPTAPAAASSASGSQTAAPPAQQQQAHDNNGTKRRASGRRSGRPARQAVRWRVEFGLGDRALGFELRFRVGNKLSPVVSRVVEGSAAAARGDVRMGDRVVEANGRSLVGILRPPTIQKRSASPSEAAGSGASPAELYGLEEEDAEAQERREWLAKTFVTRPLVVTFERDVAALPAPQTAPELLD